MNPSYTNEVGASAGNPAGAPIVSGGDIILGAPEKKSRKWVVFVIAISVALIVVGGGIALWQSGVFDDKKFEAETEFGDTRSAETVKLYEFIEENDEKVVQFLSTTKAIYVGEVPAEMFRMSEANAKTAKKSLESGLEQLEDVNETLKSKRIPEDEEIKETYENLQKALEQDLPKLKQLVELISEIFDGFLRGEDVAGLNNGDGAAVGAIFQEKIPGLKTSGEDSIASYWVKLWDLTRAKEIVSEEQNEG